MFGVGVNFVVALGKQVYSNSSDPLGLLHGMNAYAWLSALLVACCGLMTSIVMKYFDVVIKACRVVSNARWHTMPVFYYDGAS